MRLKALDTLMRSGGFALILVDLGQERIPLGMQSRLAGLAKRHHIALVLLTRAQGRATSSAPLASLRCETVKERRFGDQFDCHLTVTKDKRQAPGRTHCEPCYGPEGVG